MKPIAPLTKKPDGWWINTHELLGDSMPEYGPYQTRDDAEEDRAPVVSQIRARRKLGINRHEPAHELSANELKLAVQLLGKYTKGTYEIAKLKSIEQVREIGLMVAKWAAGGFKMAVPLGSHDTLKELLYWQAGIDPSWPEADEQFIEWAKRFGNTSPTG